MQDLHVVQACSLGLYKQLEAKRIQRQVASHLAAEMSFLWRTLFVTIRVISQNLELVKMFMTAHNGQLTSR